jgi:hypothetical protein
MKRRPQKIQSWLSAFQELSSVGVPEIELFRWIARADCQSEAAALRDYAPLCSKAAGELRSAAAALQRIPVFALKVPLKSQNCTVGQLMSMSAAARTTFGERDVISRLETANQSDRASFALLARCLDPAVLPAGLRALADALEQGDKVKRSRGRPTGDRDMARRLTMLVKQHTGKPHHRKAAALYNAITRRRIAPADFARLARN